VEGSAGVLAGWLVCWSSGISVTSCYQCTDDYQPGGDGQADDCRTQQAPFDFQKLSDLHHHGDLGIEQPQRRFILRRSQVSVAQPSQFHNWIFPGHQRQAGERRRRYSEHEANPEVPVRRNHRLRRGSKTNQYAREAQHNAGFRV
jgi:hypothetical protein